MGKEADQTPFPLIPDISFSLPLLPIVYCGWKQSVPTELSRNTPTGQKAHSLTSEISGIFIHLHHDLVSAFPPGIYTKCTRREIEQMHHTICECYRKIFFVLTEVYFLEDFWMQGRDSALRKLVACHKALTLVCPAGLSRRGSGQWL